VHTGLTNQAIVLTGASSGIGHATALALARAGARLFVAARRKDRLDQLQSMIESSGGFAIAHAADLRQSEAVHAMIAEASDKLGRIDVLINNAGFGYYGTVEKTPPALVREIFQLNFEAPLLAIQDVIPIMRRQGSGHIINVSSVVGKRGIPFSGAYCATKFALEGLSESLRLELKNDSNIRVSVINPASTQTEFSDAIRSGDIPRQFKPIGHQQTSEEVAEAIVRCIRNPKLEVYPYWPSRLVAVFNAIAPSLVDAVAMRYLRDRLRPSHD
jgi:short-subunit dehydrogenase